MTNPFAFNSTPPATQPTPAITATVAAAASEDPFSAPAPQASRGPRVRDMHGRLLLVIPIKLEEGIPNRLQPGTTQDRLTADLIILDGSELHYGGRPEAMPPVAHDKTATVPHKIDRMFLSQRGLISQCRDALARRLQGQPGMVLGRLSTGEAKEAGQNAPWLLSPPTEDDKKVARAYLAQVDPFA